RGEQEAAAKDSGVHERLVVEANDRSTNAHEEDLEAVLAEVAHREVEVYLVARQRDQVLHLVLEHLREVLARGGREEDAVERRVGARQAGVGAARVDPVLARNGEHGLGERLRPFGRPLAGAHSADSAVRSTTAAMLDWFRAAWVSARPSSRTVRASSESGSRLATLPGPPTWGMICWMKAFESVSRCATRSVAASASMPRRACNTAGGAVRMWMLGLRL